MARLVVTRPEPGLSATAAKLESMGHSVIRSPVTEAIYSEQLNRAAIISSSALIFTSRHAVDSALRVIQSSERAGITVFAVGPSTAQRLRDVGFLRVVDGGGTAPQLAHLIHSEIDRGHLRVTPNTPLSYLAGETRTKTLEQSLMERNLPFRLEVAYHMREKSQLINLDNLSTETFKFDGVLFYSSETLAVFLKRLSEGYLGKMPHFERIFCLSETIADALPDEWQRRQVIAAAPNDTALLATVAATFPSES